MINNIKGFLQVNKYSTNRLFIVKLLFNVFSKFSYCMGSWVLFFENQTVSGIKYYTHLEIA